MILHTLNALPDSNSFRDCLRTAAQGDTILLLGDGVYCALPGSAAWQALQASAAGVAILRADAAAAGIADQVNAEIMIGMDDFVTLTENFPRQLAWF